MEKNKVAIYSIIKLVRKQAGTSLNTPGALAHYEAYVFRINTEHAFIDVTYKHRGFNRDIRMFWSEEDQTYVYFDNDNNTKLYYYKNITDNPTKLRHKRLESIGVHYELQKYSNDEYDNIVMYAKSGDKHNIHYHSKNRSVEWEHNMAYKLLRAFAIMDGLDSTETLILSELINKGYKLSMLSSLKEIFSVDELNKLQKIVNKKYKAVKEQKYEIAAQMRADEVAFISQYKLLLKYNEDK